MTRRNILIGAAGAAASGWTGDAGAASPANAAPGTGLRDLARTRGTIYGAAAVSTVLRSDPALAALYAREVGIIVPDFEMKWSRIRPDIATYNFAGGDYLAAFAKQNGQKLRGHNLAWEESNPPWMRSYLTAENAEATLVDHIDRIVRRYAGAMHSWDVVNEPIWVDHRKPGGLRDGVWLRTLGARYIDVAFHAARVADPHAMLVLNEAATETVKPTDLRMREKFINLLDRLKRDGVPVDAVGLECHFSTRSKLDGGDFSKYLAALSGRGYKILITELDVSDTDEPSTDVAVRDRAVARIYELVTSIAVRHRAECIITWELSDKYSYMRDVKRPDGSAPRPLPFDANLQRKPCWQSMARAFALP
jgi:endo-1,4-beta-xylanase